MDQSNSYIYRKYMSSIPELMIVAGVLFWCGAIINHNFILNPLSSPSPPLRHPKNVNMCFFDWWLSMCGLVCRKWKYDTPRPKAPPFNPLTAELINLNLYPLEVVSRWRYTQLQLSENNSNLTTLRATILKYCWLMSHFIFNVWQLVFDVL